MQACRHAFQGALNDKDNVFEFEENNLEVPFQRSSFEDEMKEFGVCET